LERLCFGEIHHSAPNLLFSIEVVCYIYRSIANYEDTEMEKTRCPYCHEYIASELLAAHIAQHRSRLPDGQQQDYLTLPPEDRADGDLTGIPVAYIHKSCGVGTRMPDEIVRSYLNNPYLYLADTTFCVGCGKHVPNAECHWSETGENLQKYFDTLRAAKPEYRPAGFRAKAESPMQGATATSQASSFSVNRIGIALAAIIGMGILTQVPRALKKIAANQAGQLPPNNQQEHNPGADQLSEMIKRGEDVPEPLLMLSGIKPEDYKAHKTELRVAELKMQGLYGDAIKTLDDALVEIPESKFLHNDKAWILATCRDDAVRNGKMAVEHATKACELTDFSNPSYLDTLAAAHAEAGDFDSATKQIQAAMEVATDEAQKQRFAVRLELYKNREPFRQ
jgi:tetratricopeptide (TPR) repeat protein